ncbi:MAG: hypothetical protein R3174_05665 [Gammaproteobacteria bacterium]|nr:hypothetical protein [Gammaproteobacteria bacterium]
MTPKISAILRATVVPYLVILSPGAGAGDVAVEFARFHSESANTWSVSVTLRHADTGWDHYADAWRVVTPEGRELGLRTLYHPHENEQPFTRNLGGIRIPPEITKVYVEAHDKVHGWSPDRIEVDLKESQGDRYEIRR